MTPNMISIYCESLVESTYDFKIKKISAIFDPNILKINEIQRKEPFFIRSIKDYGAIGVEDLTENLELKFKQE